MDLLSGTAHTRPGQAVTRVVLVTGGIGGLGTAICRRFGSDGHIVIATHIAQERDAARLWQQELRREGFEFEIVELDVTRFEQCAQVVQDLTNRLGPVEILVNCAGITRDGTLAKMDQGAWDAVLATNLDSVFNVTRHVVEGMIQKGFGRIINISSVNGQKGQFGQTNYSAAKAGMTGFTKSLARELAEFGITVNSISPGYVGTKMVMAVPENIREAIVSKVPVGRLARPEEIGDAVAFLAAESSAYITGTDLSVNGGLYMGI
ncbi:MAG TPA: acetoacetyl-CoA reductase [Gammaproteobacteria bacterium]|nr:acetoacetyl-CoA reductase [Gammaproteobacteria bacterium]